MYDNDHVPDVPPLFDGELSLLVIGDTMTWIPAFVVPAVQNLVIGEDDYETDNQLQGETESGSGGEATRCRSCPMWAELLCERSDCRLAPCHSDRRE